MHKPMYESVDDARKGKVVGKRAPAKVAFSSRKSRPVSDEAYDKARARLQKMLKEMRAAKTRKTVAAEKDEAVES